MELEKIKRTVEDYLGNGEIENALDFLIENLREYSRSKIDLEHAIRLRAKWKKSEKEYRLSSISLQEYEAAFTKALIGTQAILNSIKLHPQVPGPIRANTSISTLAKNRALKTITFVCVTGLSLYFFRDYLPGLAVQHENPHVAQPDVLKRSEIAPKLGIKDTEKKPEMTPADNHVAEANMYNRLVSDANTLFDNGNAKSALAVYKEAQKHKKTDFIVQRIRICETVRAKGHGTYLLEKVMADAQIEKSKVRFLYWENPVTNNLNTFNWSNSCASKDFEPGALLTYDNVKQCH